MLASLFSDLNKIEPAGHGSKVASVTVKASLIVYEAMGYVLRLAS